MTRLSETLKARLIEFAHRIIDKTFDVREYTFELLTNGVFTDECYDVLYGKLRNKIEGYFTINLLEQTMKTFKVEVKVWHYGLNENRLFDKLEIRDFNFREALNGACFIPKSYKSHFRLNYLTQDMRDKGFNNEYDLLGYEVTRDGHNYEPTRYNSMTIASDYVMCDEPMAKAINEAYTLANDWCFDHYFQVVKAKENFYKFCKMAIKRPLWETSKNIHIEPLLRERNNFIRDVLKSKFPYQIDKMRILPTTGNDYEIEIYFK